MSAPLDLLLQVQELDTAADQLRHRRQTLPQRAELAAVEAQRAELDARSSEVRARRGELAAQQQVLEDHIESSRRRRSTLESQLYGGQVAAARDLQAMNDEVRNLAAHISALEDRELEVMEAIEPLDGELQAAEVRRDELDGAAAALRRAIAEQETAIDAELADQLGQRSQLAQQLPADLLTRYEALRSRLGGTGAARLVGNSCSGCHLTLPSMEVDRIRKAPPDTIVTCEQCGRILVR